jgi:hypothetical protein
MGRQSMQAMVCLQGRCGLPLVLPEHTPTCASVPVVGVETRCGCWVWVWFLLWAWWGKPEPPGSC